MLHVNTELITEGTDSRVERGHLSLGNKNIRKRPGKEPSLVVLFIFKNHVHALYR